MINVNKNNGAIATIEQTKTVVEKNRIFKSIEKHAKIDRTNVDPSSELVGFVCACTINDEDGECIITKDQTIYLPKFFNGSGFFHRFENVQIYDVKISLFNKEGDPKDLIYYVAKERHMVKRTNIARLGYTTPKYHEKKLMGVV